jgi:hypothetical protein
MKRLLLAASAATIAVCLAGTPAGAQDGGPAFQPLEMWACTFRDRMDQGDMDGVYERVAEGTGDTPYAAWQLTPYMAGNRYKDFDFIYLGAWPDGSTMGADLENYFTNAGDAAEAWEETAECAGFLYASNTIQEVPDSDDDSGNFMLTISDCKVAHGRTAAQAIGALNRYNDYRVANGSAVPTFAWFPAYGNGGAEFDFKLAQAFAGPQEVGDSFSWFVDNQAYNVNNALTQGLVDCDEARLYFGRTIMDNMN